MKRFHIHVSVNDLTQSIRFYSTLFGAEPSRVEADYAKWMLEDPRLNFAISAHRQPVGRVIGQRMRARLRFEQQREGRIPADIDPLDRIHLYGDI